MAPPSSSAPAGAGPARGGALDAALVAAVRDEVIASGIRRATASAIAARAGVHRVTLYRRGGGIQRLILDALARVFADLVEEVRLEATGDNGRARVADFCARGVTRLRAEPLVAALVDHDPELLLPSLVDRLGASQEALLAGLEPLIVAGIADGSIRPGRPDRMALVLGQAATPFVLGRRVLSGLGPDVGDEVRRLVDGYLHARDTDGGARA